MSQTKRKPFVMTAALTCLLVAPLVYDFRGSSALAASVSNFYKGKQIRLVIGYGPGGGYDAYARLLSRFMSKYIPGNPTLVPENMPGAGSRAAANWLYNVAPRDGSILATISETSPTDQALKQKGVQFDVTKMNWIGNMVVVNDVLYVWSTSGIRTIQDAMHKQVIVGGSGATAPSVIYPQVSDNLLGTKFKTILGYSGSRAVAIAMERREVDGRGGESWASVRAEHPDWLRMHKINVLFQVGLKREPDLPNVPLWLELAKNDDQRKVLKVLSSDIAVGRPIVTTPGVPSNRVQALRQAFDETMKDPAFIAAAAQSRLYLKPASGEKLQQLVAKIVNEPPKTLALVKQALKINRANESQR